MFFEAEHVERVVSELLKKPQLWDICSFELLHSGRPKKIAELIDIINRKAALQFKVFIYY
ncbi:MAG: hypothetical protein MRQ13_03585 [Candidatus Midichloria sp.]|nr:hypothetical protein [Candidatus Midichloria sp.]